MFSCVLFSCEKSHLRFTEKSLKCNLIITQDSPMDVRSVGEFLIYTEAITKHGISYNTKVRNWCEISEKIYKNKRKVINS